MENTSSGSPGLIASVTHLCAGLIAGIEDRLKLLALELHEEKIRLIQIIVWTSAAVFAAMMALGFLSLTVVFMFWGNSRLLVLGAFAFFYTAVAVAIALAFRRYLARQPKPFNDTLEELKEDRECIQADN